ncbi:MAG: TetR/AcrR family transcriptional regulator [Acidobacteriota bacterium]
MSVDLREQVLLASVELIGEAGLGGLSMREVARRAGVSHQAPYHYFGDKAAIVAALVGRGFGMLAERLEEAAAGAGEVTERLERVGRAYVHFALEEPVYFRLLFRLEVGDLGRYPEVEAAGARACGGLERLVAEKAGAGARQGEREALASLHWSVAHGLATLLVDGNLGLKLGTRSAQEGHVDEVLRLFGRR